MLVSIQEALAPEPEYSQQIGNAFLKHVSCYSLWILLRFAVHQRAANPTAVSNASRVPHARKDATTYLRHQMVKPAGL